MLGVIGGLVGIACAFAAKNALVRFTPRDFPQLENVAIDLRTLGFALALSLITGLLFGVVPATLGWRSGSHDALRAHGKGAANGAHGGRTRSTLTALEVAFAVVLLVGAGLMIRSFALLTSSSIGVQPEGVTVAQLTMVGPRYRTDDAKVRAIDAVLRNIRALPGVAAAGASTSMPPSRMQQGSGFQIVGTPPAQPGQAPTAVYIPATTGFFEALGIPITRGRAFDTRDDATSPLTMLVSQEFVRRHLGGLNPIGQQVVVDGETRSIVGVTGDAVYEGVGGPLKPVIYVPYAQSTFPGLWIAIRSNHSANALAAILRDAIHRVDADLPAQRPESLASMIDESVVRPRFNAWLLSTFGGLALLLAGIGVYSVIAYGVSQRRSEIGIRLALGAPGSSVVSMVLRAGMTPVVGGIMLGLIVAYAASRLVAGLLYGIEPTDPVTFAAVAGLLALAGVAASSVPALRASRVDPLTAIRSD